MFVIFQIKVGTSQRIVTALQLRLANEDTTVSIGCGSKLPGFRMKSLPKVFSRPKAVECGDLPQEFFHNESSIHRFVTTIVALRFTIERNGLFNFHKLRSIRARFLWFFSRRSRAKSPTCKVFPVEETGEPLSSISKFSDCVSRNPRESRKTGFQCRRAQRSYPSGFRCNRSLNQSGSEFPSSCAYNVHVSSTVT